MRLSRWIWVLVVSLCAAPVCAWAGLPWFALGPYGGDARSIAADPNNSKHLYLGTANGWVYESRDGGAQWTRLAQIAHRNDLVIDHILVDTANPKRLIVGAWVIDRPEGGLFISEDAGKNWYDQAQMRGQSIRSMARGLSNPKEIVAGTLKGVFRSMDNAVHWTQISPAGSTELHEVESIAIDPTDGNTIYAGTWHLPWKTTDGGASWVNIKEGIIDDSDVFSIIIDPNKPNIVYASACSGIYKSVTGAEPNMRDAAQRRFEKVNGIPSSARRTRKLEQDPNAENTVYAGTTEGLYRTMDAGHGWERLTAGDVIVNDVYVDPANSMHVLLATDRGGVLRSEDGGATFEASNTGFSARQVVSYAQDPRNAAVIYTGVVNDKTTGGVFASYDGGLHWEQHSQGLGGRDVFSLLATDDGTMLAGTGHGVFRLQYGAWSDSSAMAAAPEKPVAEEKKAPVRKLVLPAKGAAANTAPAKKGSAKKPAPRISHAAGPKRVMFVLPARNAAARKKVAAKKTVAKKPAAKVVAKALAPVAPAAPTRLDAVVYAMAPMGEKVYAGTGLGLMMSDDHGQTWSKEDDLAMPDLRFLGVRNKMIFVGTLKRLALSMDAGESWDTVALPKDLTQISAVEVDDIGNLWVGGREGIYYSTDYGETWKTLRNLFMTQVDSIFFDAANHRVLVTSTNSTFVFAASLPDYKVTYWDSGWNLRFARPVGDHLIGATLFDGMVVQPKWVDTKVK